MRDAFGRLLTPPDRLTRRERVDCLRRLSGELQAAQTMEQVWLGRVLAAWLENGGDLEQHLGVRPPQGSHARAERIVQRAALASLLGRFVCAAGGVRLASRVLRGERECPPCAANLLAQLRERRAPTSAAAISRARRVAQHR